MKLVVTEYMTLDGVIDNPTWIAPYFNDEFLKFKFDELMGGDVMLMGRKSYEMFADVWTNATAEDDAPGQEGFADRMHDLPKYVVSTTMDHGEWHNTHFIQDNVVETITRLKAQPGQDILVAGSGELIKTLMQHDLVDEYRFLVYPLVVAKGQRLFEEGDGVRLKLVSSTSFETGVLALIYQPDRSAVSE
jgi:dihydrofolate reductase